jgi:hypothetical protein
MQRGYRPTFQHKQKIKDDVNKKINYNNNNDQKSKMDKNKQQCSATYVILPTKHHHYILLPLYTYTHTHLSSSEFSRIMGGEPELFLEALKDLDLVDISSDKYGLELEQSESFRSEMVSLVFTFIRDRSLKESCCFMREAIFADIFFDDDDDDDEPTNEAGGVGVSISDMLDSDLNSSFNAGDNPPPSSSSASCPLPLFENS